MRKISNPGDYQQLNLLPEYNKAEESINPVEPKQKEAIHGVY